MCSKLLQKKSRGFRNNNNKPCFDEECSELANKRKQTKLLRLQNPNNQTAEDFSMLGAIPIECSGKRSVIT